MKQRHTILGVFTLVFLLLAGCRSDKHFVGVYETLLPGEYSSTRTITLDLKPDHTATLTSALSQKMKIEQKGKWQGTGSHVSVDLQKTDKAPEQMLMWLLAGDQLMPVGWDRSQWGTTGLRLQRKQASAPAAQQQKGKAQ